MTREEAIKTLSEAPIWGKDVYEAVQMAIKALSQEPTVTSTDEPMTMVYPTIVCDDAISREAVINAFANYYGCKPNDLDAFKEFKFINELPSVIQKSGKWIPVSERLPDEYGEYLVTWKTNDSSTPFISVCEYEISYEYDVEKHRFKGEWLVDDYILVHSDYEVVAWMPLPKPYEPQESEE